MQEERRAPRRSNLLSLAQRAALAERAHYVRLLQSSYRVRRKNMVGTHYRNPPPIDDTMIPFVRKKSGLCIRTYRTGSLGARGNHPRSQENKHTHTHTYIHSHQVGVL